MTRGGASQRGRGVWRPGGRRLLRHRTRAATLLPRGTLHPMIPPYPPRAGSAPACPGGWPGPGASSPSCPGEARAGSAAGGRRDARDKEKRRDAVRGAQSSGAGDPQPVPHAARFPGEGPEISLRCKRRPAQTRAGPGEPKPAAPAASTRCPASRCAGQPPAAGRRTSAAGGPSPRARRPVARRAAEVGGGRCNAGPGGGGGGGGGVPSPRPRARVWNRR